MRETVWRVVALGALAVGLSAGAAHAGDVRIGINIGTPPPVVVAPAPPTVVLAAPPSVVLVPGTSVYHVPSVAFNLFLFSGRYYTLHNGHWFHSVSYNGPWIVMPADAVPRPVLGVPVAYYRVPPGHAKKAKHHDGAGHDCPPGQAKKGRC